jgi:hypothetical protein
MLRWSRDCCRVRHEAAARAAQGCDTFALSPDVARALFKEPLTIEAAADFEQAARALGGT